SAVGRPDRCIHFGVARLHPWDDGADAFWLAGVVSFLSGPAGAAAFLFAGGPRIPLLDRTAVPAFGALRLGRATVLLAGARRLLFPAFRALRWRLAGPVGRAVHVVIASGRRRTLHVGTPLARAAGSVVAGLALALEVALELRGRTR